MATYTRTASYHDRNQYDSRPGQHHPPPHLPFVRHSSYGHSHRGSGRGRPHGYPYPPPPHHLHPRDFHHHRDGDRHHRRLQRDPRYHKHESERSRSRHTHSQSHSHSHSRHHASNDRTTNPNANTETTSQSEYERMMQSTHACFASYQATLQRYHDEIIAPKSQAYLDRKRTPQFMLQNDDDGDDDDNVNCGPPSWMHAFLNLNLYSRTNQKYKLASEFGLDDDDDNDDDESSDTARKHQLKHQAKRGSKHHHHRHHRHHKSAKNKPQNNTAAMETDDDNKQGKKSIFNSKGKSSMNYKFRAFKNSTQPNSFVQPEDLSSDDAEKGAATATKEGGATGPGPGPGTGNTTSNTNTNTNSKHTTPTPSLPPPPHAHSQQAAAASAAAAASFFGQGHSAAFHHHSAASLHSFHQGGPRGPHHHHHHHHPHARPNNNMHVNDDDIYIGHNDQIDMNELINGLIYSKTYQDKRIGTANTAMNDYSQHFVDTQQRPQNFIRELAHHERLKEYPKLRKLMQSKNEALRKISVTSPPFYINTDLRTFDLAQLRTKFDVILVDPPWRAYVDRCPAASIRNAKRTPWTFDEMSQLRIQEIAENPSFLFLWCCSGSSLNEGRLLLKRWGYKRCEVIVWLKTNKKSKIQLSLDADVGDKGHKLKEYLLEKHDDENMAQNDYGGNTYDDSLFVRSYEHCLMGIRGQVRRSTDGHLIHANVDTDVIITESAPYGSTAKPNELYDIIERFCMGRKRLELFGCQHNLRPGWLTIGNDNGGIPKNSNFDPMVYNSLFTNTTANTPRYVPSTAEIETLRPKSPIRNNPKHSNPAANKGGNDGGGMPNLSLASTSNMNLINV